MLTTIRTATGNVKGHVTQSRTLDTIDWQAEVQRLIEGATEQVEEGKPGCPHKFRYSGTFTIRRHRPDFFTTHLPARLGFDWDVCTDPDCSYAVCYCTDPEIASTTEPPFEYQGEMYYTIRQVLYRLGKPIEQGTSNYISSLLRRGVLHGVQVHVIGKGQKSGRRQWFVSVGSFEAYAYARQVA